MSKALAFDLIVCFALAHWLRTPHASVFGTFGPSVVLFCLSVKLLVVMDGVRRLVGFWDLIIRSLLVGDSRKSEFATQAFSMSDPTLRCNKVPEAVDQAIAWVAKSEGTEVRAYRENVVSEIERMGRELRNSGACDR